MQVLLNENVVKLGRRGDIVNVKPGYFRNYLLPKGFAVLANDSVKKLTEKRNEKMVMEKEQLLENAKEVVEKLKGVKLVLKLKATKTGKLYAAVDKSLVLDAIEKEAAVRLDDSFVETKNIKEVGEHSLNVKLGEGFEQEITVVVEAE